MTALKRPDHEPKVERYYPDVVAPAKELKQLAAAENPEFQILWDQAWEWMKNTFVYDFSEDGCQRWEKMLDITPDPGESFEDRRAAILATLRDSRPHTERTLKRYVSSFRGGTNMEVKVIPADYRIQCTERIDDDIADVGIIRALRIYVPSNLDLLLRKKCEGVLKIFIAQNSHEEERLSREIETIKNGKANLHFGIMAERTKLIEIHGMAYDEKPLLPSAYFACGGVVEREVLHVT